MLAAFNTIAEQGMGKPELMEPLVAFAKQTSLYGLAVFPIGVAFTIWCTKMMMKDSDSIRSTRDFWVTLLLAASLGAFGAHRFYAGKIGSGIIMLLILGGLTIWISIDLTLICLGKFTDSEKKTIFI